MRNHRLLVAVCLLLPVPAAAQEGRRLDLPVRKPEEKEFMRFPSTVSVLVSRDGPGGRLLYAGQGGQPLAVTVPARAEAGKDAKWQRRLVLPVRRFDDQDFDRDTPKVSIEVYRDEATGAWIYVSHAGGLAVLAGGKVPPNPQPEPVRLYRLPLKARPARGFAVVHKCNVEVYRDDRVGALLYVAEGGQLAVLPAPTFAADWKATAPAWSHTLDLAARTPDADEFTKDTTRFGVEVYQDPNARAWVYLTEKSQLAVVPGAGAVAKPAMPAKAPIWQRRLRGTDFAAEVFQNPNAGHTVYATPQGAVAVAAPEKAPARKP